jgi:hypothetical protein
MFRTTIKREDTYQGKLAKLLPAEMVAAYMALNGIVNGATELAGAEKLITSWVVFGVTLIVTVIYLILQNNKVEPANKMKPWEIALTSMSFVIWALSVGAVLQATFPGWKLVYENLIVAAWTLFLPLFISGE